MSMAMTRLEYALAYALLGWHVHPLHHIRDGVCSCGSTECVSPGKHPLTRQGLHDATTDEATIRRWWTDWPDANIGVRTGTVSGIVAIDVDSRHELGKFGDEEWVRLVAEHGEIPETVEAITGSGGRHLVFALPEGVVLGSGAGRLAPAIDHRGEGGYIVVEPSSHLSGRAYAWEASSSPLDGVAPAPVPAWIAERLAKKAAPAAAIATGETRLEASRYRELRSALTVIPSDDRDTWLRVGMALHATGAGPQAFGLWTEWSQTSDKYDPADQARTWKHFRERPDGISPNTIFSIALAHGWAPPPDLVRADVAAFSTFATASTSTNGNGAHAPAVFTRTTSSPEVPPDLLAPPGVLADIAAYGLASAVRPVPAFAVQAALALGSVVCARRYVTTSRNFSSLYFLNVAKSGTGKEEAKTTIEAILSAAGFRRLVGGSSYSSGGAVYSALLRKPQHIAIVDEFGKYMETASATRDSFRGDALNLLIEAFGRVHADMSTPQFSTMTLSATHAAGVEPKMISRPAITLLAMTTPSSFYGALSSTRVLDGFLNRFLVVEHTAPRTPAASLREVDVPPAATAWVKTILAPRGDLDELHRVDHLPDPVVVPLTPEAERLSATFERTMLTLADRLEAEGLGDMPIRTREIGLRIGLICALADTPDTPVVTSDLLEWAFRYVEFYLHQTVDALRERMADTPTERHRKTILAAVRGAGESGITERDLNRHRAFVGIPTRERKDAVDGLMRGGLIEWRTLPVGPKGGRPRTVLVAIDPEYAEAS